MARFASADLFRQELQERLDLVGFVALGRRELPEERPELCAKLGETALDEALDRGPASASV